MDTLNSNLWMKKAAAVLFLPLAALTFTGCGTSGPEEGVDVEDVVESDEEVEVAEDTAFSYDADYNTEFYDEYDSLVGETVRVSATVNEVITPAAFTIAGTDDTTVEPLLVVTATPVPELEEGLTVAVTGIVRESFVLTTVEEDLGLDLEDEAFVTWESERYLEATEIEVLVEE
jgi:hypothetical protein